MKFSKVIVVLSFITVLTYTAVHLYFSWHDKFIPDSLTYSFYGMFAVELSALAGIKIKETVTKVKERYNFEDVFPL